MKLLQATKQIRLFLFIRIRYEPLTLAAPEARAPSPGATSGREGLDPLLIPFLLAPGSEDPVQEGQRGRGQVNKLLYTAVEHNKARAATFDI